MAIRTLVVRVTPTVLELVLVPRAVMAKHARSLRSVMMASRMSVVLATPIVPEPVAAQLAAMVKPVPS